MEIVHEDSTIEVIDAPIILLIVVLVITFLVNNWSYKWALDLFFLVALFLVPIYFFWKDPETLENFRKAQTSDPWCVNLFMYFFVLVIAFICTNFIFDSGFIRGNLNANNARYFFSSITQIQGAIISIVITLTIIGMQVSLSRYPARIADAYKKYPDLWLLLVIYINSILFGAMTLFTINSSQNSEIWDLTHEFNVQEIVKYGPTFLTFISIFLLFLTLGSLIPYIWNTMNILRIDVIVARLSYMVDPKYNPAKKDQDYSRIRAIYDIIENSIRDGDSDTALTGYHYLKILVNKIKNLNVRNFQNDKRIKDIRTLNNWIMRLIGDREESREIRSAVLEIEQLCQRHRQEPGEPPGPDLPI